MKTARLLQRKTAIAAAGVALTLCLFGCKSEEPTTPDESPAATRHKVSPHVALLKTHDLQGKVVLIEFGAIGCELSQRGLDKMIAMHRAGTHKGLAMLRVESNRDQQLADKYYADRKPPFTVDRDIQGAWARSFDATVYPYFVLVDKFGRVRYRGNLPDKRLAEWVEAIAAETADVGPEVAMFGAVKLDVAKLLATTKLPDLQGDTRSLADYRRSAGLVMVFVDTSCPYSEIAIKEIAAVSGTLATHEIPIVLVNIDDGEDLVKRFYNEHDTQDVPVVYDVTTATRLKWNILSVPTVLFVNADGKIGYNGKAVWSSLAAAVEKEKDKDKLKNAPPVRFKVKGTEYG